MTEVRQERIIMWQELLVTQINHWGLFPVVVMVLNLISGDRPELSLWLVCSLLPFFLFLVRRYTDHYLILLGSHGILAAGMYLLPVKSAAEKILLLFFTAGYLAVSISRRLTKTDRLDHCIHPGVIVGLGAFSLLMQRLQGKTLTELYYVIPVIAVLGMYLVQYYMRRYLHFLIVNESSTGHIPQREIYFSGLRLTALYTGAGVVLLLLTSNMGWLTALAGQLMRGLRYLVSLIPSFKPEENPETAVPREEPAGLGELFGEGGGPSVFWMVLEKIVIVVFVLLAAGLLVWAAVKIFRYLRDRFRIQGTVKEEQLQSVRDVREKCSTGRERTQKRSFFSFLTPGERIRRIYKKRVWAGRYQVVAPGGEELLERLTARECGRRMDEEALALLYEKARYSGEECTSRDVRAAKEKS